MDTNHFFSFSRIAMVMKREIIEKWFCVTRFPM